MLSTFVPPLMDHLWQSTVFAIAAGLLTLALKRNRARTRYWIWLTASLKFLIPFSLLISVGSHFSSRTTSTVPVEQSVSAFVIGQVAQPFTSNPVTTVIPSDAGSAPAGPLFRIVPAILLAVWFSGCLLMLVRWWSNWRRVGILVANAERTGILTEGREFETLRRLERAAGVQKPIAIVSSKTAIEPSVFGVFRAVLLWPVGLSERLRDEELDAIILHELSHLRRRDNLIAALHMVVEAVFWFHPLVWWLGMRLVEEREKASDDDVLAWGRASHAYAEGILKVCEFCLESPLVCAAGITGSNLKNRIEDIMRRRVADKLSIARVLLLAAAAMIALAGPIVMGVPNAKPGKVQLLHPVVAIPILTAEERPVTVQTAQLPPPPQAPRTAPPQPSATPREAFEVVSVKPAGLGPERAFVAFGGGCDGSFPQVNNNRFVVTTTPFALITWAYRFNRVGGCSFVSLGELLSGGPDWIRSERFEIQAVMPEGSPTYTVNQFLNGSAPKLETMLQTMLADRFKLALHIEMREKPVFALVLGNGGPKFTASKDENVPGGLMSSGVRRVVDENGQASSKLVARKATVADLGLLLTLITRRPVVDRTGLTGEFDFEVDFAPENAIGNTSGPSIFTAVQEQLGLRLESARAPVEVLVIDRAEKPSEN